jgi:hypothetical protein
MAVHEGDGQPVLPGEIGSRAVGIDPLVKDDEIAVLGWTLVGGGGSRQPRRSCKKDKHEYED